MHRQLDDDLRDSEMEVLLNHTRHCPDCAAMFERLTRLSAELTSLPKVTPSYSLVDAIMPELLRIDNEAKQAANSASSVQSEDVRTIARRTQRARRFPSWKSISGVVAAGIVAGFFLITYPPQLGTGDNDSAANIHNAAGGMLKESAQEDGRVAELRSTAGGDEASDSMVGIESASPNKEFAVQNEERHENMKPDVYTSETEPGEAESAATSDQDGGQGEFGSAPDMGIAGNALFPSPDGQYVASIDEHSIVIAAADGSSVFKSEDKNGTHGNLVWSPESRELTYDVSLNNGATEKYVIDLTELAERKAE